MAVDDCSVTERRWWRPPYQTGKSVHVHANTLQTQRGQMHDVGCTRPWIRTAEPFKLLRKLDYNKNIFFFLQILKKPPTEKGGQSLLILLYFLSPNDMF